MWPEDTVAECKKTTTKKPNLNLNANYKTCTLVVLVSFYGCVYSHVH